MIKISLTVILFSFTLIGIQAQSDWTILDNYQIAFDGTGAEGNFKGLKGNIVFDKNNLSASYFDVTIDPATISTGNNLKNEHARGDSWFDVGTYPNIKFISTKISKKGDGFEVNGNLSLHGTTKPISITFNFNQLSENTAEFNGQLTVNRESFGIEGPMMAFMVGDEFDVNLKVKVKK